MPNPAALAMALAAVSRDVAAAAGAALDAVRELELRGHTAEAVVMRGMAADLRWHAYQLDRLHGRVFDPPDA